jgi:hypothetical protein
MAKAPEKNPIEQLWEMFAKETIPEGAPSGQVRAMYIAFLAGADTVLQLESTVRDRESSHRHREAFKGWKEWVDGELKRIAEPN